MTEGKKRIQRLNCYTCGVLLKKGEERKRGEQGENDVRYFCETHVDQKAKPIIRRRKVTLIKRD